MSSADDVVSKTDQGKDDLLELVEDTEKSVDTDSVGPQLIK